MGRRIFFFFFCTKSFLSEKIKFENLENTLHVSICFYRERQLRYCDRQITFIRDGSASLSKGERLKIIKEEIYRMCLSNMEFVRLARSM